MTDKPSNKYWINGWPHPILRYEPNTGERFWLEGEPFQEYIFGASGNSGDRSFDLRLEVQWHGVCPQMSWDTVQEQQTVPAPGPQEEAAVAVPDREAEAPRAPVPTVMDDSPEAAQLYQDADLLERHVLALLDAIRQRTKDLRFEVPSEAVDLRAALVALQMAAGKVDFDDYLNLLLLQIETAERLGAPGQLQTAAAQVLGQMDVPIQFFESRLEYTFTESSAWATQAKPLVKTLQTSRAIKSYLTNYRQFGVNNTILKAMGGKASLADIIRECFPCLERALDLRFNPFAAFLQLLQAELQRRWNYIRSLWQALNSTHLNICDLARFLNTMCLPDLFALLAMLAYFWLQLMQLLRTNVWNLLWSLLQPLLANLLTNLVRLLDQFIHLLLGPIRCIISSLDREFAKVMNVTRAFQKDFWTKGPHATKPYEGKFAQWAQEQIVNPVFVGNSPMGMGLLELKKALQGAEDMLNAQLKRLRDAIREALGVDADALDGSAGLFMVLRWLSMVIALVRAFIKFKQDGFKCGPDGRLSPGQYQTLMRYLQQEYKQPLRLDRTVRPVAPEAWPLPPLEQQAAEDYLTQLLQRLEQVLPPLPDLETFTPPPPGLRVPDCLALEAQLDAQRAASWAAELDALIADGGD